MACRSLATSQDPSDGQSHKAHAEDLSLENLRSRGWEFSAKVNRNVARSEVTQHTEKVWEATMEDVAEKVTVGPFYSHQEVSDLLGATGGSPHNGLK